MGTRRPRTSAVRRPMRRLFEVAVKGVLWVGLTCPMSAATAAPVVEKASASRAAEGAGPPTNVADVPHRRAPLPGMPETGAAGHRESVERTPGLLGASTLFGALGLQSATEAEGADSERALVTDRPDFTESPVTVGRGTLQIEGGYTFAQRRVRDGRHDMHSLGELLFRYGVGAEWLELRAGLAPVVAISSVGNTRTAHGGVEDLQLGFKIAVAEQEGWIPRVGVIAQWDLPTGDDPFTSGRGLASGLVIYGWDHGRVSLTGQTGLGENVDAVTDRLHVVVAQSLSVGVEFTDRLGGYFEWFAVVPAGADTERPQHYVNGGLTVLIGPDVQWDVRIGHGLTAASDDFFIGTGLSVRFMPVR